MRALILTILLTLCSAVALAAPPFLVLDDCEGAVRWSCVQAPVTKTADASRGQGAIQIEVAKPVAVELRFDGFAQGTVDLAQYDLIAFDYKLSGPVEYLDFVIRQYPLLGGGVAHYYPIDQADPRERWATKILPLDGPENLLYRADQFDPKARELYFSCTVAPSLAPMRLAIDNVRVMKNPLGVRPITFGRPFPQADGSLRYQYSIPVRNEGTTPLEVAVRADRTAMKTFQVSLGVEQRSIAPGTTEQIPVAITIPADIMRTAAPYTSEELTVEIMLADLPDLCLPTRMVATVPPKRVMHPSLLGTMEELKGIPAKVVAVPELKKVWDALKRRADEALKRDAKVPDYNGIGPSTCLADGTKLTPVERPGFPVKQYMCAKCGQVYHGKLYDSFFSGAGGWYGTHQILGQDLKYLAFLYRVTGEKAYAARAAEILRGYTEKYLTYDELFEQPPFYLTGPSARRVGGWHFMENSWLMNLALTYDLLRDTGALTPAEQTAFEERVLWPAAQKTTENEIGLNNIQLFPSGTQIAVGTALEYAPLVHYGAQGPRGVVPNVAQNLLTDGTWAESPNYINLVASSLPQYFTLMKRAGLMPYTPSILKLYTEPVKMASPAGKQPNFGDGTGVPLNAWGTHATQVWLDTRDPEVGKVVKQYGAAPMRNNEFYYLLGFDGALPTEAPPAKLGCVDFPGSGYLFLRNASEDIWFAMVYGRHLGHGHFDRLSFELYGGGALQAVDDGAGPYDTYHDDFDVRTLAHSTMLVDMQNHLPAPGKQLCWQVEGPVKLAAAGSRQLAEGAWMERNVALFPGAVVLVDGLQADKPRTFDWVYHNVGAIREGPTTKPAAPLAETGMYSFLQELRSTSHDGTVKLRFRQENGTGLAFTQFGAKGTTLYTARTGHGYGHKTMAATILARRVARETAYITLLEPLAKDGKPTYRLLDTERKGDEVRVDVTDGTTTWRLTVRLGEQATPKMACEAR